MSWTLAQIEHYNLTQPADYNMVKDLFKNYGYTIHDHCIQPRRYTGHVPNYQHVFTHITKSDRQISPRKISKWLDHHCHFKLHVYENKDMKLVCPPIHYKNAIGDKLDWKLNEKTDLKYLDICSYSRIEVINLIKQISDVIDNIASSC